MVTSVQTFERAGDFLRKKNRVPTEQWTQIWKDGHDTAFTVAGATKKAVLEDLHKAVLEHTKAGGTLKSFRADFDKILVSKGWSATNSNKTLKFLNQKYRARRTKVIYETNLRQSYAAGRYQQAVRLNLGYARYIAVLDANTRSQHRKWHGITLPINHPWWDSHTPMNGWGCRCSIQYLDKNQAQKFLKGKNPDKQKAPKVKSLTKRIKKGGSIQEIITPQGVDAGFAYNPGKKIFNAASGKVRAVKNIPIELQNLSPITPVATKIRPLTGNITLGMGKKLVNKFFGKAKNTDQLGNNLLIGDKLPEHLVAGQGGKNRLRFLPFVADIVKKPHEIWQQTIFSGKTGKPFKRNVYIKSYQYEGKINQMIVLGDVKKKNINIFAKNEIDIFGMMVGSTDNYVKKNREGKLLYRENE